MSPLEMAKFILSVIHIVNMWNDKTLSADVAMHAIVNEMARSNDESPYT